MKIRNIFLLVVLVLAGISPSYGESHDVALGANGDLYRIRTGIFRDLFPTALAQSDSNVLALDVTRPGPNGPLTERLLVPGTNGNDVESSPSLFFEESAKSIFLVWESRINPLHSVLYLTSLANSQFGEVVQISSDRYSFKSSPRIAVSHDSFELPDATGNPARHYRTIVETVWWETTGSDDRAVYAPVVLIDGEYIGWNPVFQLDDLSKSNDLRVTTVPNGPLLHAPSIQIGDGSTTVATFVNSETGLLNALEIDALPVDLSDIAARVRAKILTYPRIPSPITPLADAARAQIIEIGSNLHPSIRGFIADATRAQIIEIGARFSPGQVRRLADATRAQIIEIGADTFGGRGGRQQNLTYQMVEVLASPTAEPTVAAPGHVLSVHTAASLPVPDTGDAVPNVYASTHGDSLIVSWRQGDKILYRESTDDGWTDVLSIALGPNMTPEQAEQILAQRARNR